jgi:hypothetical protein
MRHRFDSIPLNVVLGFFLSAAATSWSATALAQTPPEEDGEEAAAPAAAAPAPAPAEPAEPDEVQSTTAAAQPPAPETPKPPGPPPPPPPSLIPDGEAPPGPMAPAFPPAIPSIDYGGRVRTAVRFQSFEDPEKLNDVSQIVEADLYMSGQVHRMLKWQSSITLSYSGNPGQPSTISANPLDLIARFEPVPEFNVYMGRMLVVVDRFAPSGPWGMDEFFFPGFFPLIGPPALPKAGQTGRDVGTTIWGAPFGGHLKYYLGAFNLYDPMLNPLLSGRVQVSLLNGEPAFYHRTTYMGTKDLISIGVGGQYQKEGSVLPPPPAMPGAPPGVPLVDDYSMVTGDLTVEKTLGESGTVSVVGGYSKFSGDYQPWEDYLIASVGYLMPKPIGIGKPRIALRFQRAMSPADGAEASTLIDAQLSYNVAAWFARFQLGYRRGESYLLGAMGAAGTKQASNAVYLGMTVGDP